MLSRVANAIYWMQRYRERAENVSRLIEVNLNLSQDLPGDEMQWLPVLQTTGDEEAFQAEHGENYEGKRVLNFLTFDPKNPNSILSSLYQARENARSVREIITSEMWHELNTTYLFVQKTGQKKNPLELPHQIYNRVKRQCQLVTGIADTTMSRSEPWHFGRLGSMIERADMTSRMLDVKYFLLLPSPHYVGSPFDNIQWSALLKSASAYEMYRKKWQQIQRLHVVDFLILDREFPRAIYTCLKRAEISLAEIDQLSPALRATQSRPLELLGEVITELENGSAEAIEKEGLHEFLDALQRKFISIDGAILDRYFALRPTDRIVAATRAT